MYMFDMYFSLLYIHIYIYNLVNSESGNFGGWWAENRHLGSHDIRG